MRVKCHNCDGTGKDGEYICMNCFGEGEVLWIEALIKNKEKVPHNSKFKFFKKIEKFKECLMGLIMEKRITKEIAKMKMKIFLKSIQRKYHFFGYNVEFSYLDNMSRISIQLREELSWSYIL